MADKFRQQFTLPPILDPDTVTRELTVAVNGTIVDTRQLSKSDVNVEYIFVQGDKVRAELVDLDDGVPQNRSVPSVLDYVVTDTVPPAQPGAMIVTTLEEIPDSTPSSSSPS